MNKLTVALAGLLLCLYCSTTPADEPAGEGASVRHGMILDRPANNWLEAPPCGNGFVGAMPYGPPSNERILLNHEALFYPVWYTPKREDVPDMAQYLPQLRQIIARGKYRQAAGFWNSKLAKHDYGLQRTPFTNPYHPACDLLIQRQADAAEIKNYQQSLDLEKAEIVARWTESHVQYERCLFVSRADDVVVLRLRSSNKGALKAKIALTPHAPRKDIYPVYIGKDSKYLLAKKAYKGDPIKYKTALDKHFFLFQGKYHDGRIFGAVAAIKADGGKLKTTGDSGMFEVTGANEVLVTIKLFANEKDAIAVGNRLKGELEKLPADYEQLLTRHVALHRKLFNSMTLDIASDAERQQSNIRLMARTKKGEMPSAFVERLFDFGRYALICSSRPGGLPANLQGVWSGSWTPCWSSDYTLNINVQMAYWPALPGNLPEMTLPYFDYFDSLIPDWRVNAKRFFGCRGSVCYLRCSDHGLFIQDAPWQFWTAGVGWLSQLYYDYYLFTGDEEFLKKRAVPFMKEAALFYEDFVVEGKDGKYLFTPSQSPENIPGNSNSRVTMNATMDIAVAKEVFTNLIAACEKLGIEKESIPRWRKMIEKLPAYQVDKEGRLKEWITPKLTNRSTHRHMAHLYPLIPGFEVDCDEGAAAVREGCRVVLNRKLRYGGEGCGFSWSYQSAGFARLGEAEKAKECLRQNALNCSEMNLFSLYKAKLGTILIDGNAGFTSSVLDMLLYSKPGVLKVLTALPKSWPKGEAKGMLARGGLKVDLKWNMQKSVVNLTLQSKTAQKLDVRFPGKPKLLNLTNATSESSSRGSNYLKVSLPANNKVSLKVKLD